MCLGTLSWKFPVERAWLRLVLSWPPDYGLVCLFQRLRFVSSVSFGGCLETGLYALDEKSQRVVRLATGKKHPFNSWQRASTQLQAYEKSFSNACNFHSELVFVILFSIHFPSHLLPILYLLSSFTRVQTFAYTGIRVYLPSELHSRVISTYNLQDTNERSFEYTKVRL